MHPVSRGFDNCGVSFAGGKRNVKPPHSVLAETDSAIRGFDLLTQLVDVDMKVDFQLAKRRHFAYNRSTFHQTQRA